MGALLEHWKYCGNIVGTLGKHCSNIGGTCRNIVGMLQEHCVCYTQILVNQLVEYAGGRIQMYTMGSAQPKNRRGEMGPK